MPIITLSSGIWLYFPFVQERPCPPATCPEQWDGARTSFSLCPISQSAIEAAYGLPSPSLSFSLSSSSFPAPPSLHIWALPSGCVQQSAAAVSWLFSATGLGLYRIQSSVRMLINESLNKVIQDKKKIKLFFFTVISNSLRHGETFLMPKSCEIIFFATNCIKMFKEIK